VLREAGVISSRSSDSTLSRRRPRREESSRRDPARGILWFAVSARFYTSRRTRVLKRNSALHEAQTSRRRFASASTRQATDMLGDHQARRIAGPFEHDARDASSANSIFYAMSRDGLLPPPSSACEVTALKKPHITRR